MKRMILIAIVILGSGCNSGKSCQDIIDAVDDGRLSAGSEEAQRCLDYAYDICFDWMTDNKGMDRTAAEQYCKADPWRVL